MEYSDISKKLTKTLDKAVKKENGIYFTPPACVNKNIELLRPYLSELYSHTSVVNCLEPSCGSGEYITGLLQHLPEGKVRIDAVEYNRTIYDSIKDFEDKHMDVFVHNADFLSFDPKKEERITNSQWSGKYDLIIGNPPYFVMKKEKVPKKFHPFFDGRPNIFILFIIRSLELLVDGGILSFILPKSFLNCLYYDKLREHIVKEYEIIDIVESHDEYLETEQKTVIFMLRKRKITIDTLPNKSFFIKKNNHTIFGSKENIIKLISLYENSTTLDKLGFTVSVGNVVWNQCKKILTHDTSKTRLIYSSDIKDGQLIMKTYSNTDKKNYLDTDGTNFVKGSGPLLVLNRGYGTGEYNFDYCLINQVDSFEYLIENHLICIRPTNSMDKTLLLESYQKIIRSFNYEKTKEFISIYFGNNAMNTTELAGVLPVYKCNE